MLQRILRERQSLVGGVGSIVETEREREGEPNSKEEYKGVWGRGIKTEELSSLLVRESNPRTTSDPCGLFHRSLIYCLVF